ncbi:hypothetical protein QAD02_013817 [Eretmocerus hayati]|uniref:Uncharacterized protein n=1 Tax=Eretmocerus hayati TaxID=131215 RepID=A0ACC2P8C6_9HYME|nr:hypothetical protein QAD02_013817 [Eretmocerus hayati]
MKTDIKAINASELTKQLPDLAQIIDQVYPLITESKMKSKLTRIKNKIKGTMLELSIFYVLYDSILFHREEGNATMERSIKADDTESFFLGFSIPFPQLTFQV